METTGRPRQHIRVVSHADCGDADRTDVEPQLGAVERVKAGVDIGLEMATSSYMSLTVAFLLRELPAQFIVLLYVALCILILCIFAV